jgi:hypothetical protein
MTKEKNNTLSIVATLAIIASLFLLSATIAFAASDNATTNESFTQGLQKDGNLVNVLRSDPSDALGATDGEFVSLGYGGEIVVGFAQNMSGNLSLAVKEFTANAYPLETADVYVGTNPAGPWTFVGEATNDEGEGDEITTLEVGQCYQYVQIIDTTDGDLHNDTSDGFDVDSLTAEYDETCPVVEEPEMQYMGAGRVNISLHSGAMVVNDTETVANTGGNLADGSYAGAGGHGGDINNNDGDQDVETATTGTGGDGGTGGLGGAVQTGDALAVASVTNTVNSNVVRVGDCECDGEIGRVRVRTHDFAALMNRTGTGANTGDNDALGSYGNDGGNGGSIANANGNGDDDDDGSQEVDDATTGNGGAGGGADAGGSVLTGRAEARTALVNLVNSNRIQVR